jgi:hypothetical protein
MFIHRLGKNYAHLRVYSEKNLKEVKHFLQHSELGLNVTFLDLMNFAPQITLHLEDLPCIKTLQIYSPHVFALRCPANLEHLACDSRSLDPQMEIPNSLVSFHDLAGVEENQSLNSNNNNRKILELFLRGEKGEFLKKIQCDHEMDETMFQALSQRQTVLQEFCYKNSVKNLEHLKILWKKVEKLTIRESDLTIFSLDLPESQVRSLHLMPYSFKFEERQKVGKWLFQLQECFFDLSCCVSDITIIDFKNFILQTGLEQITFYFPNFWWIEKIPVIFGEANFSTQIFLDFGLPDQYKWYDIDSLVKGSQRMYRNYFFELDRYTTRVCIRRARSWLPQRHNHFCHQGKTTLRKFCLGLTRLKKFSHLIATKREEEKRQILVHVDPACMEWILEAILESDFY